MKQCWAEQADTRPSFSELAQSIKLLNGGKYERTRCAALDIDLSLSPFAVD